MYYVYKNIKCMDLLSKLLYYNMKTIKTQSTVYSILNWQLHFCSQSFSSTDLELGFEGVRGYRILKVNKLLFVVNFPVFSFFIRLKIRTSTSCLVYYVESFYVKHSLPSLNKIKYISIR